MLKQKLNRKKVNPHEPTFTGIQKREKMGLQLFKYNATEFFEDSEFDEKSLNPFPEDQYQYWLNIHGIHDVKRITNICETIGIHPLAIQDILDVNQRPKFQEYTKHWFFSIKSSLPSDEDELQSEQLSFILGENYIVSFQELKADHFGHVRQRIREKMGIVVERSCDYLLYLLFESILDNYFKTVANIEVKLMDLKLADIELDPKPSALKTIELYKQQIHQIKRTLIPIKEFVTKIEFEELKLVRPKHLKYFYELKDLCLSLIDDCDEINVRLESHINLFFSIQGQRMNQVMKTLTVVSTIFIPLTFIAGIYGMNFNYMPELTWKWGYFGIWFIMVGIFGFMLSYFRRKKWF